LTAVPEFANDHGDFGKLASSGVSPLPPGTTIPPGRPAQVVGNSFTLPVAASVLNGQGLTCPQGTINLDGTFAGTTVSGTLSSTGVVCNGVPVTITGNYTATRQSALVPGGHRDGLGSDLPGVVLRALIGL
jgi:hypothetical protein